ncbi:bifunctional isocitrate dehydrogenase kinase/phosphatase, partial [Klebsiella pneumoniae]|nr:bifunctional isocitrate dehydrogenase kinase/phosphatase [Klebsiella pneumoniae]
NFQIHVLASLFFRNKAAYVVGRIVNGDVTTPFAMPIMHDADGYLALDTVLLRRDELRVVFSFTHAYFMVDMEVPSAYVQFLRT